MRLRNVSEIGELPLDVSSELIPETLQNLELWYQRQSIELPTQTLDVAESVALFAGVDGDFSLGGDGDERTELQLPSDLPPFTANIDASETELRVGSGPIGTDDAIPGNAVFAAKDEIYLANAMGGELHVHGLSTGAERGLTQLISLSGGNIIVGGDGETSLKRVAFFSQSELSEADSGEIGIWVSEVRNDDFVTLLDPASIGELDNSLVISPRTIAVEDASDSDNVSGNLRVESVGSVTDTSDESDTSDAKIEVHGNALFLSDYDIVLADGAWNEFLVEGDLHLVGRNVQIGSEAVVLDANSKPTVVIGQDATDSTDGVISAQAEQLELFESGTMVLGNVVVKEDARFESTETIRNATRSDWQVDHDSGSIWAGDSTFDPEQVGPGDSVWQVSAKHATLRAGDGILLAEGRQLFDFDSSENVQEVDTGNRVRDDSTGILYEFLGAGPVNIDLAGVDFASDPGNWNPRYEGTVRFDSITARAGENINYFEFIDTDFELIDPDSDPGNGTQVVDLRDGDTVRVDADTVYRYEGIAETLDLQSVDFPGDADWSLAYITNQAADDTLEGIFGNVEDLVEGDPAAIDTGRSLSEVGDTFSIKETLESDFAIFVKNLGSLEILSADPASYDAIELVGADLNLYIETIGDDSVLVVGNDIQYKNPDGTAANGGLVLISGAEFDRDPLENGFRFENGAVISSSTFLIINPELKFVAYNGGDGPGGHDQIRTTFQVVPFEYFVDDSAMRHEFLQVAAEFGTIDETGFRAVIGYDDGRFQEFPNQPLGNLPGNMDAAPDGRLFQRSDRFSPDFLVSQPTIPTTILMSRAEDVFLFSGGGKDSMGSAVVSAVSDNVTDIFTFLTPPPMFIEPEPIRGPEPLPFVPPPVQVDDLFFDDIEEFDEPRPLFEGITQADVGLLHYDDNEPENGVLDRPEWEALREKLRKSEQIVRVGEKDEAQGPLPTVTKLGVLREVDDSPELSSPPTVQEISDVKEFMLETRPLEFEDGPYGILIQDRFSPGEWKVRDLFTKPVTDWETSNSETLPPTDREEAAADAFDDADEAPNLRDGVLDDSRRLPENDEIQRGELGGMPSERGAIIASALWLLHQKHEVSKDHSTSSKHSPHFQRFKKARRRLRQMTISN